MKSQKKRVFSFKKASPKKKVKPVDDLISAEKLCELTGDTDRWHREIASRGYFPPPVNGWYRHDLALKGLFKFKRELAERGKESLAAKQETLLDKRIERADFDLAVSRKEFKPTEEICQKLMAISEEQKSLLAFYLMDQLPALNAGLDAGAQRKNNREAMVAICKRFQDWAKAYMTKQSSSAAA